MSSINSFDTSIHTHPPPLNSPVSVHDITPDPKPIPMSSTINSSTDRRKTKGNFKENPDYEAQQIDKQFAFDVSLLGKVLKYQPFNAKYGEKTIIWGALTEELRADNNIKKKLNFRNIRSRYNSLMKDFQKRLQVNNDLQKLMASSAKNQFKGLNKIDAILLQISKIPIKKDIPLGRFSKVSKTASASPIATTNKTIDPGNSKSLPPISIDSTNQQPTSITFLSPQLLPTSFDEKRAKLSPKEKNPLPQSSSVQSIFSDEQLEFYKTVDEVFSSDQDDYSNDYDYDCQRFHYNLQFPKSQLNWNVDQLNRDDDYFITTTQAYNLEREKMQWRWEYLNLIKAEMKQRKIYREKKLELFKRISVPT